MAGTSPGMTSFATRSGPEAYLTGKQKHRKQPHAQIAAPCLHYVFAVFRNHLTRRANHRHDPIIAAGVRDGAAAGKPIGADIEF
jgi:hypothetical protein